MLTTISATRKEVLKLLSIFDIIGPIMIGPSSSHTAGAARLARVARRLAGRPFTHVTFGLYGSFHDTYMGHGTDLALLAGALGYQEDDEALRDAKAHAKAAGITYNFQQADLSNFHENSVEITFHFSEGDPFQVIGSSIGGGQIAIYRVDGMETEFSANAPTLLVFHRDRRGIISEISKILSDAGINIGLMRYTRRAKGCFACAVIEMDDIATPQVVTQIAALPEVYSAQAVDLVEQEGSTHAI